MPLERQSNPDNASRVVDSFWGRAWLVPFNIAVESTVRRILGTHRLPMFFGQVALLEVLCFTLPFLAAISGSLTFLVLLVLVSFFLFMSVFSLLGLLSGFPALVLLFLLMLSLFLLFFPGLLFFSLPFL